METPWKITSFFIGLVIIGLCSGFPIGLENSAADYHTQFLTGLVGVLLTVCGVVFLIGCLCCQRKNGFKAEEKKKEFHNSPVVASSTSSLDHGHINPISNGEFTIFTPLSPPHHNNNVFLANEQIVGQTEIDYNHADIDVHSWFDGTESEFPRTKLKYIKELGKGWFGKVVEGTAQGLNGNWTPVAVRILEATATSSERAVFLHDATIYRCGKHPHILQLLGRSLESVPLLLLQELCPHGDLKKYLRDNRRTAKKLLVSDLPLRWCCQLSSALQHLHDHKLTHPDLATRNCQITSDLSLKLGDYGLAANLYPEDYYQGAPAVPVRWCAPECLTYTSTTIQPKQTTFESNVWSLGVTMWEIYECGVQPYAQLNDDEVISQVLGSANVRLQRPEFSMLYTDYIFRIMQHCWSTSESRPSVSQVYLMLTDLMQVVQLTKHETPSTSLISMEGFDKRWDTFKPNSVARTDNHEFNPDQVSMADVDLSDITVLNMNLNKEEELLNTKPMSPSLNNLHGSLDNLTGVEMDSWLQKVATKTGDMSYVRGLSEAIKDLDNALALENVSSSDSSHQPSPAPENLPKIKNKLEFKLGPTTAKTSPDSNKTPNSSLTESMQRTSSESETEDENWRRKIEQGAYSEKVHQKSKSVTDLMVLTHIDCSESDSETPLPSLDYRVNYKNVRYAPKQNLENVSLMFGSEGNLLSVHDKFQEELRRLQEERKDSLLFVPELISVNDEKPNKHEYESRRGVEYSSSDDETWTASKNQDATCTYVNTNPSESTEEQQLASPILNGKNTSPNHRNTESLIEELSNPTDIQPGSQVYNIFNVTVDANFSPMHISPNLKDIICYKDLESNPSSSEDCGVEAVNIDCNNSELSTTRCFQVPKLTELIQNNDELIDFIIAKYESQDEVKIKSDLKGSVSEKPETAYKELNNNIQKSTIEQPTTSTHIATREFLLHEQENYQMPKVQFDVSLTQDEVSPSTMTHSAVFTSTPFTKHSIKNSEIKPESLQFSSNFSVEEEGGNKSDLKYSLETWDNFLGKAFDGSREHSGFDEFTSEPQSLLFVDDNRIVDMQTVECKNGALIESFKTKGNYDLDLDEMNEEKESGVPLVLEEIPKDNDVNATFTREDAKNECLNATYEKQPEPEASSSSNWEPGEGWFLHPQTDSEVSGQMAPQDEESYVRFSVDDEIMAAIRNELLMKLPQAQGQSSEQIRDSDDWDAEGRSEVLIKYNVYTTPLSPIPEESFSENDFIYNREDSSDSENDDWPEPYEEHNSGVPDTEETQSVQNVGSPPQEPQNRHTPSQDSCCSNDTLFNLEELTFVVNENELKMHADTIDSKCEGGEIRQKIALKINFDEKAKNKEVENCKLKEDVNLGEIGDGKSEQEETLNVNGKNLSCGEVGESEINLGIDSVMVKSACIDSVRKFIEHEKYSFNEGELRKTSEDMVSNCKEEEKLVEVSKVEPASLEKSAVASNECNIEQFDTHEVDHINNPSDTTVGSDRQDAVSVGQSVAKLTSLAEDVVASNKCSIKEFEDVKIEVQSNNQNDIGSVASNKCDIEVVKIEVDATNNSSDIILKPSEVSVSQPEIELASVDESVVASKKCNKEQFEDVKVEVDAINNQSDVTSMQHEISDRQDAVSVGAREVELANVEEGAVATNKCDIEEFEDVKVEVDVTNNSSDIILKPSEVELASLDEGVVASNKCNIEQFEDVKIEVLSKNQNDISSMLGECFAKKNASVDSRHEGEVASIEEDVNKCDIEKFEEVKVEVDAINKSTDITLKPSEISVSQPEIDLGNVEEGAVSSNNCNMEQFEDVKAEVGVQEIDVTSTATKDAVAVSQSVEEGAVASNNCYTEQLKDVKVEVDEDEISVIESAVFSQPEVELASGEEGAVVSNNCNIEEFEDVKVEVGVPNDKKPENSVLTSEIFSNQENEEFKNNKNEAEVDNGQNRNVAELGEANIDSISISLSENDNEDKEKYGINKLNLLNIQNGIVPGHSPKWSNSIENASLNDENLINGLDSIKEASDIDISLLVENNPNYITEFLNHERQSSISSLGSSRDDDDFGLPTYVNVPPNNLEDVKGSRPTTKPEDSPDYVNTSELLDLSAQPDYVNLQLEDADVHLYDMVANDDDIYDALTDIRFTGPSDVQLMSTSFSESAEIDEQDWDSGSDTRSSSSGEFIWKEGEHEESVKALRAAPQDAMATDKIIPMEDIEEVSSENSSEDEDGDSPEFVPSAWDKYATPTKSALRSPEKTLEKSEIKYKKPKGVWFKKQKYHCVYEYPREPETPNVNNYELWQPVSTSLIDWEVDTSPYVPNFDGSDAHPDCYPHLDKHARNLYHLSDFAAGMTLDDEFFISSTAKPFESFGCLSSQFFPGQNMSDQWQSNENITPDSGVEDITPADNEFLQPPPKPQVQPLKQLAGAAVKHNQINELKHSRDCLGGLRHARNKLKLDLPPSPSAFTSTKAFTIEPPEDEVVTKREVPTFTTFGKSRFLVQHVDTPTYDEENDGKNVSFEALPYKPVGGDKTKVEIVRGEASLLDSADEDSGIESSTLERKKITNLAN